MIIRKNELELYTIAFFVVVNFYLFFRNNLTATFVTYGSRKHPLKPGNRGKRGWFNIFFFFWVYTGHMHEGRGR